MPRLFTGLACLALIALPLTQAGAQGLGRLVKKAKDKAVDATGKALDTKKPAADSTRPASVDTAAKKASTSEPAVTAPSRAPEVPAKVADAPLLVTDETYALFFPVLQADAARRKALLDYRRGIVGYNTCKTAALRQPSATRPNAAAQAAAEARRDSIEARWTEELRKKPGERNLQRLDLLRDSLDYAQELAFQQVMPATLKCGTRPFRQQGFTVDGTPNGDTWPVPKPDPVLPSGMSWKQYGLLRERVGIWVVSKGAVGAPVLDAAEVAVLKAHQADLMAYADYFSMRAMDYLTWGDVAGWR